MVSGVAIRKLLDTLGMGSVDELMAGVSAATPNPHGVTTFPFFNDPKVQNEWSKVGGLDGWDENQVWNPLPEGGMRLDYIPDESAAEPQLPFIHNRAPLALGPLGGLGLLNALGSQEDQKGGI